MKNYFEQYIKLCKNLCRSHDGLANRSIREKHNKAMSNLHKLELEMNSQENKCSETVLLLLEHDDELVQISAAAYCIKAQLFEEYGLSVLTRIENTSDSYYNRYCARNCKLYCTPYKP